MFITISICLWCSHHFSVKTHLHNFHIIFHVFDYCVKIYAVNNNLANPIVRGGVHLRGQYKQLENQRSVMQKCGVARSQLLYLGPPTSLKVVFKCQFFYWLSISLMYTRCMFWPPHHRNAHSRPLPVTETRPQRAGCLIVFVLFCFCIQGSSQYKDAKCFFTQSGQYSLIVFVHFFLFTGQSVLFCFFKLSSQYNDFSMFLYADCAASTVLCFFIQSS